MIILKRNNYSFIPGGEQREFARADYEGLSEPQIKALRKKRADYAHKLRENYRTAGKNLDKLADEGGDLYNTKVTFNGGGIKRGIEVNTPTTKFDKTAKDFLNRHKRRVTNKFLDNSEAKKLMRENVVNNPNIPNKEKIEELKLNGEPKRFKRHIDSAHINDKLAERQKLLKNLKENKSGYSSAKNVILGTTGLSREQQEKAFQGAKKIRDAKSAAVDTAINNYNRRVSKLIAKKTRANNLKTAGGVGLGLAAAGGLGYLGYRAYKKNKEIQQ